MLRLTTGLTHASQNTFFHQSAQEAKSKTSMNETHTYAQKTELCYHRVTTVKVLH